MFDQSENPHNVIDGCFRVLERDWSDIWDRNKDDVFALRWVATARV